MSTRIPILLGAGDIGDADKAGRVSDPAIVQEFVDILAGHGQIGVDTSRLYCKGSSEKLIGQLDFRGVARVDTKIYPAQPGDHSPQRLKEIFKLSVEALNGKKIRVFYLHAPDRSVPFEDTLEAANDLHKAGGFEELGLSNFMAWEVAEVVAICKRRNFVQPTVYQGVYNLLDRLVEEELLPCLRKFGLKFAAYSPLAGGYLTDKFFVPEPGKEQNLKFTHWWYKHRYSAMSPAVLKLQQVAKAHDLTLVEVAYRWLQWHSKMQPGDYGIVMAASRKAQVVSTVADCEKGPLPDEVVQVCEDTWKKVKSVAQKYFL